MVVALSGTMALQRIGMAHCGTRRQLLAAVLIAVCIGCGDSQADEPADSGRPGVDSGVGMADAAVDSGADAALDAGQCCPIDPQPDCCMRYGGSPFDGFCGTTCDGMPYPNDPRWKIGSDAQGCPMWIEPEVIGSECCGCPDIPDSDAG
jgi:hypothetical protein